MRYSAGNDLGTHRTVVRCYRYKSLSLVLPPLTSAPQSCSSQLLELYNHHTIAAPLMVFSRGAPEARASTAAIHTGRPDFFFPYNRRNKACFRITIRARCYHKYRVLVTDRRCAGAPRARSETRPLRAVSATSEKNDRIATFLRTGPARCWDYGASLALQVLCIVHEY